MNQETLQGFEDYLKGRVLGQVDAVERVANAVVAAEYGLDETGPRPKGTFLLMGPTGVGKTETAKGVSDCLFGPGSLEMLFCNEYQAENKVPEFVVALANAAERHPHGAVVLLDEIDKIHKAGNDVLLSALDEGQVTLPDGRRVSLTACYLMLTSNVGSSTFGHMESTPYARMEEFAYNRARESMRPELFGRLTQTIVYRPLSQEVQEQILGNLTQAKLRHLATRFALHLGPLPTPFTIHEPDVSAHLLDHGFSQAAGARRLREELNRQFNRPCLPWLLRGQMPPQNRFFVDAENDQLVLK